MAAECLTTITEPWIRERLQLKHPCLGDVRSLSLPGTSEEKIRSLGNALNNFVRLKSLDLSCNVLVSIEGVQHLKVLERLILYYNDIPSLKEVKVLFELPVLREIDLRLNPLTKRYPQYRPCLVHAMPNLRNLDGCSVRDTERKAAIMQFSSDLLPLQKRSSLTRVADQRSSDQRLASVDRLTKRRSLLTDTDDIVLNFVATNPGDQSATQVNFVLKEVKEPTQDESQDFTEQRSSTPKQETSKSILRYPPTKYEECRHVPGKQKQKDSPKQSRHAAKGHYTPNPVQSHGHSYSMANIRPPSPRRPGLNLSDRSNPILHPPRLTYSSLNKTEGDSSHQGGNKRRGSYRKPPEILLNLVAKHWSRERSLHHNNNFLSQAVQILSMMEDDISCREAEVRTLRQDALNFQEAAREEEHKSEVRNLSAQLDTACSGVGKLKEKLRIVLDENVALHKRLIELEGHYLKSRIKGSPITQIKETQTEVDELRKENEGLRVKLLEAENSTICKICCKKATAELKGSGELQSGT
ncbi:centrosomal protein of 72 kDa isoform X2 [Cyclopterus lumpus]|uniref:centrosomal protein of 72 kDa isoform X2 n=1 Tax=Cyclopterus lumpus TaxID=8103 RepID=UPI00148679FD|nr:centrosomal protein of 72 kDa isoform X2 [Cyclopterus lumpus]